MARNKKKGPYSSGLKSEILAGLSQLDEQDKLIEEEKNNAPEEDTEQDTEQDNKEEVNEEELMSQKINFYEKQHEEEEKKSKRSYMLTNKQIKMVMKIKFETNLDYSTIVGMAIEEYYEKQAKGERSNDNI